MWATTMRLLLAASLGGGGLALVVDTAIQLDTALHPEDAVGSSATIGLSSNHTPSRLPSPASPAVRLLSTSEKEPSAYEHERRVQSRMPSSLTRALEALPPVPQAVTWALTSGLSLLSAGAKAAASNVVPKSWLEPAAPAAGSAQLQPAPAPPGAVAVKDVSPSALASRAPSVLKFVASARKAAPAEAKASYYLVETHDAGLWHRTSGLAYRRSKSLEDRDPGVKPATWGSTVSGADEGDGWLKVGERYLPVRLDGKPVLTKATPASGGEAALLAQTAVEAVASTCPHPAMPEKEQFAPYLQCLAARCEDWDPSMLSGVSCEATFLPMGCEADLSVLKLPVAGFVSSACPTLCGTCTGRFQQVPGTSSENGNGASLAKWTPSHVTAASILRAVATPPTERSSSSSSSEGGGVQGGGGLPGPGSPGAPPYRPSMQASGIEFQDEDDRPDYVRGRVLIKKAKKEDTISHYNLCWARAGNERLPGADVIQVLPHGNKDIEYVLPSSKIPEGAEGLMVLTSNPSGIMASGPMVFWDEPAPSMAAIFRGFLGMH